MDLVERLNYFVKSEGISPSVLADTCGIPRPTVSQLLNGRSKKISDDIISKIHKVYPNLSVLWLMFGEGQMLTSDNNKSNQNNSQQNTSQNLFPEDNSDTEINQTQDCVAQNTQTNNFQDLSGLINLASVEVDSIDSSKEQKQQSIHITPNSKKTITNIVVFYSDNSFQSFSPSHN